MCCGPTRSSSVFRTDCVRLLMVMVPSVFGRKKYAVRHESALGDCIHVLKILTSRYIGPMYLSRSVCKADGNKYNAVAGLI